ncbi:hypothetical protein B9G69_000870 [Bdellovibrio sp. SKB1291214]|uniref:hypothetical protein n=1 Tax=Bdellovibrio sp. SKB1291214 TaxID=1732569 RepID=UPI000B519D17|nr:hypothetical protein [Bdellovibrio sp. SKB1291214]UYL09127.1 hypothetical protein B9G69_000870 [Bdellovibrio sp. SKB1291214]
MAQAVPASHKAAQKRLTKAEFKLFSQSHSDLKKIPSERIRKARAQAVEVVKKHRKNARAKADDKTALRELNFRLRSMEKTLERFDRVLNKERIEKRKAKAARGKKSLTEQPKMHLKIGDEPRESFLKRTKQKIYSRGQENVKSRFDNAPQSVGKHAAGFSSARSRKGQVARDRGNSSES